TPLALVIGPIDRLLEESKMPEQFKSLLRTAQCNGRRLLRLVDQVLDFRKQESGLMQLRIQQMEAGDFLAEVIETFRYLADEKRISLHFDHDKDQPITLWADPEQLEKVVFNLLSNAFKFTQEGGQIRVKLDQMGPLEGQPDGIIQIIVEDSGIGIPEEKWSVIFGQFYQAHDFGKSESGTPSGSGIGLALADGLIKLHGGTISVTSNLRSGSDPYEINTRFIVSLPTGKAHLSTHILAGDYMGHHLVSGQWLSISESRTEGHFIEKGVQVSGANLRSEAEKPLILVVDDNDELRSFIADGLRNQYTIMEANDGSQAWELIKQAQPDIVISDVMMPVSDGIALLKKIKSEVETNHITVILLTALTASKHVITALEKGGDDYITKPFSFEVIRLKIANLLQTREGIRKKFFREYLLQPSLPASTRKTPDILTQVIEVVENNMNRNDFTVNTLAAEIGISRTALYQKIKQITGLNIIEFINAVRLRRAAQLLTTHRSEERRVG